MKEQRDKVYRHTGSFDGLGSVVALSDSSRNIVESYSYDVFGEPNRVSDVNNPYFFTGRQYDSETGLYYYRARHYHPQIGRFLQPDPVAQFMQLASVQKLSRYDIPGSYVSPMSMKRFLNYDPTGRFLAIHPAGRFLQNYQFGFPVELNLYSYCGNNSIVFVDLYGLGIWTWIGGVFEATGGMLVGYNFAAAIVGLTAPAWVLPVGVGFVFFGIGNQIGDMIFDNPLG